MTRQVVQTLPATTLRTMLTDALTSEGYTVDFLDLSQSGVAGGSGQSIVTGAAAFHDGGDERHDFSFEVNYSTVLHHIVNFNELEVVINIAE